MNKYCVVSIVSANYFSYACTLRESLLRTNKDFDFRLLIVNRRNDEIITSAKQKGIDITFAEDLDIICKERIFYKYDIVELNTALKPTFIKQTLSLGYDNVLYIDPDIYIFNNLYPVIELLGKYSIVLTPHSISPVMDGLRPSDIDFLRNGSYNLGFIAVNASDVAFEMLDWWESRCLGMGFNDPSFGTFVDQKWIDLVPSYFSSVAILRHPGCNVAYWNLHERIIKYSDDGVLLANNQELIFFHFSGVVPENDEIFSKHQNRHLPDADSLLMKLVKDYIKKLHGYEYGKYKKIPYGYGQLDNGTFISQTMRRAIFIVDYIEEQPFSSSSKFQNDLLKAGITGSRNSKKVKPTNTMSFEENSFKVKIFNFLIRLGSRVLGLDRFISVLRYAALMNREGHLASVLLKRPLNLIHKLRY